MKLRSLTVSGFKSFADKVSFDFHDGVTAVVGPNGCGKSNVVDAVKWVLGEQSAKSLRGGEMMDVIFNGTAARKASGFAEVALSFNEFTPPAGSMLEGSTDTTVTVARRLYRSGESEYLINGTSARLKDIREMFLDTGANIDAYSVIEQGKVEGFLQANNDDRRAVFDEAAGISRYKARKREAERRLERVEQNLLRLGDILGEVQKRLRSIKYQAGKARNYQQYSQELKDLRSLFSLAEYHRLNLQRRSLQEQVGALTDSLAGLSRQLERLETARAAAETEAADLEQSARAIDGKISALAAQIAATEQRIEMMTSRAKELTDTITADASRAEQLEAKAEENAQEIAAGQDSIQALTAQVAQLEQHDNQLRAQADAAGRAVAELRRQLEDEKNGTIDLLRRTAQLHNEVSSHSMRRENLSSQRQRLTGRAEEVARQLGAVLTRRAELAAQLERVKAVIAESQQRLDQAHAQQKELQEGDHALSGQLSRSQQEHSALLSRKNVLEEMQQRLEGVGEGAKRLLNAVQNLPFIRGLLGDFLDTDVDHARLIESALGGADQWLLADSLQAVTAAAPKIREILGEKASVQILCLDQLPDLTAAVINPADIAQPQATEPTTQDAAPAAEAAAPTDSVAAPAETVAATPAAPAYSRAIDLVRCGDASVAKALQMVLGQTLIVPALSDALAIRAGNSDLAQARFIAQTGELLETDGRVRIGAGRAAAGVIWRRSELAELARKLQDSQVQIDQTIARQQDLRGQQSHLVGVVQQLRTAIYEANTERVECQTHLQTAEADKAKLQREAPLLEQEVGLLAAQIEAAVTQEQQAKDKAVELDSLRQQREAEVARLNAQVSQAAQQQEAVAGQVTSARVALAEARQKKTSLEEGLRRLTAAAGAITQEIAALREHIEQCRQRKAESETAAAEAAAQIEALRATRTELEKEAADVAESRRGIEQRLAEIRQQLADDRKKHDEAAAGANALKLQLGEVEVRIEGLIARTAEELGMDLPAVYPAYQHDDNRDWEAVKNEIGDLRAKIERLGNVNLDAIGEQDELQKREEFLIKQVDDIKSSQGQLAELIKKINAESKQRFEESFAAVRSHFNELFRKLFGGGKADILLTNPEDVLESGIEIVARPPGKELRSISLMSGGEKTMTALALLFSFFKSRPSPFCVLDEVDAALDEANTQRFVMLVREFLATSQFVVISHSKRTIAMANQIYGVTMQEPGCSTKISVKFEEAQELAQRQSVGA